MYHLVWTTGWQGDQGFGHAHSKDLVHWSPQQFVPVMEHEPTTVNVWAPELFYDERQTLDSSSAGRRRSPAASPTMPSRTTTTSGCITRRRSDFKTFAPAKLFFDPGFSVIDCDDRAATATATCWCSRKTRVT